MPRTKVSELELISQKGNKKLEVQSRKSEENSENKSST